MRCPTFVRHAAGLFGLVALAHVARLAPGVPVVIDGTNLPLAVSWVGAAVAGASCVPGLRARA